MQKTLILIWLAVSMGSVLIVDDSLDIKPGGKQVIELQEYHE